MSRKMKDSGVEWIGEIPEDWEVKQLRTYFSRRINKNIHLQEKNLLSLSYGRIVRKNIDTKEGLLPESFDGYNIIENGDIVIRGTDLQNDHRSLRTGLATERGIITSAYMTLRPQKDVNSTYYHYLLHCYDISKVFYSMGGGLRQSLDYWEFIRMPVLHPTDREQEEIVSYIKTKCTAIDTAIEKTKKSIEKLEEYKKAVITKAVTKGIDPNAKMKDSGVEWIGEIPEGWEITRNKFYVIISHGMDPKTEGDIPVYGSGAESFKSCGEYKEGPAVLLGRKGATLHIPHYITGKYWNVDTAFDVKTKSEDMGLKYFYFLSMCFNYNYYIAKTTLPSMTQFDYCNMRIPLPSRKEQDIIVSYIEDKCVAIDTAIEKKKEAIEKWEEYKKSLIYYAVTGKIDCRGEEL